MNLILAIGAKAVEIIITELVKAFCEIFLVIHRYVSG